RQAKAAVRIPIIASLNGSSPGGWTEYARLIEQAGADALELNIYYLATDMEEPAEMVEGTYLDILEAVKSVVSIPVAVKLSPFFSSLANLARCFDRAGANGLVLFNRFYQPDIDLHTLDVRPNILLSTPQALRLPMRWIAILFGRIQADLAATSGIHHAEDVIKLLLVGARATMLCSVLLHKRIGQIRVLERTVSEWLEQREYESVQQMQGSMSQLHSADPGAFERAQYVRGLQNYRTG